MLVVGVHDAVRVLARRLDAIVVQRAPQVFALDEAAVAKLGEDGRDPLQVDTRVLAVLGAGPVEKVRAARCGGARRRAARARRRRLIVKVVVLEDAAGRPLARAA